MASIRFRNRNPDGVAWYGPSLSAYVEIISHQKLPGRCEEAITCYLALPISPIPPEGL
jgi:hypothetical protein